MLDLYKQSVIAQFEAALWMLHECIRKCPPQQWAGPESRIAKYEFWHVVHHTLSCTDGYLSPDEHAFHPRPEFHPAGKADLEEEYPSRQFSKDEMLAYTTIVLEKMRQAVAAETEQSLRGPSGFSWLNINRAEMHQYNTRHVMHHTGQLSALLRRLPLPEEDQPRWGRSGWGG